MKHDSRDAFDMRYRVMYDETPNSEGYASKFAKNETS